MNGKQRVLGISAAFVGTAAAFGWSGTAIAQDQTEEGAVPIFMREEWESFGFLDFGATFDFDLLYSASKTETDAGDKTQVIETIYRETLELDSEAYIYHPNFVFLNLSGRFGLVQQDLNTDALDTFTTGTLLDFDLSAQFLRESSLPVTIYSRRSDAWATRPFGPSLRSVLWTTGGILQVRSGFAPTNIEVFHLEQEQSSPFDNLDYFNRQNTFNGDGQLKFSADHELRWDATFDNVKQSSPTLRTNSFDRLDASVQDDLRFGGESEHSLTSTLQYLKETGQFPVDSIRITEALRLHHSQNFETRYNYAFSSLQRSTSDQINHVATAQMRHQLFDSLTTTAEAGVNRLEDQSIDFTSDQLFGSVNLDYTKKVPYGQLSAAFGLGYSTQRDSNRGSDLVVVDELQTFDAAGIITVERRNIVESSVVITDLTGLIVYTEGVDYSLRAFSDRLEVRRKLGGAIADGESVLIDYRVGPEPGSTTDTTNVGGSIRYTVNEGALSGLSLYARYFEQMESRTGAAAALIPEDDVRDLVFGLDYEFWKISFGAEREIRKGGFNPFEATRLDVYYNETLAPGSSLTLSAFYQDIQRTDEDVDSTVFVATGRWNQQWSSHLRSSLALTWRDERDQISLNSQAFEQQLDLAWQYRQTSMFLNVRNSFVNNDVRESSYQTLTLGIRREF